MPVIGTTVDNGRLSFIYKLGQNDFLCAAADAVHAAQNPNFKKIQTFTQICW